MALSMVKGKINRERDAFRKDISDKKHLDTPKDSKEEFHSIWNQIAKKSDDEH